MRWFMSARRAARRWRYCSALAALATLLSLIIPMVTWAHPLGNFTINHYSRLELTPDRVRVFYVLDMAEIPTFQTIQQIDRDGDKQVSADEGKVFAMAKRDELRRNIRLTINGTSVALQPDSAPELSFPPGQGGLALLRLTFWLDGALPAASQGTRMAEYDDHNDRGRIGWREIVVQGQPGMQIFDSTVSDHDQSDELRAYPQDMLASPLNQSSARFSFQPGARPTSVENPQAQPLGAGSNDGAFAALITLPSLDLRVVLLAFATALGLGALHALEPGHGKTAAAAYLVGARATPRHALLLGLTITAMHTSSVFVLGLVTLFASQFILPERLLPWLGLASGLIVIAVGLRMFLSRWRHTAQHDHAHDHHDHIHHHNATSDHDHTHDHGHSHLPAALTTSRVGWREVLAIGVSGGLLPCPAGLVVLLSAIGLGRIGFGLLLIVAFSAGLAVVLSGIGLTVLYSSRWLSRNRADARLARAVRGGTWLIRALPALSGLLVVAAGALLLYHALPLLRVWRI